MRKAPRGSREAPSIDPSGSVLHVFLDVHLVVGRRVDRAIAIDHDADWRLHLRIGRHRGRNEIHHLAVLHAADADAALAARIVIGGALIVRGLGIDHIQHVVLVDGDTARPTELLPGGEEFSVLVEDHDAAVAAVGDVEVVLAVESDRMRRAHLPVAPAIGAEGLDEFAVLGEHHDTRVIGFGLAMAFADVDVAIGGDGHTGRRIEDVEAGLAGAKAWLAELQEHAAVGTELRHLHSLHALRRGIRHPEIAILIDGRLMRLDEEAGAEIPQCLAVGAEFDDRNAVVRFATINGPEVIIAIDRDRIDRAPGPRRRGPIRYQAVGIGQIAVRLRTGIARLCGRHSGGDDSGEQRNTKSCRARTHVVPPLVLPKAYRTRRNAYRPTRSILDNPDRRDATENYVPLPM